MDSSDGDGDDEEEDEEEEGGLWEKSRSCCGFGDENRDLVKGVDYG